MTQEQRRMAYFNEHRNPDVILETYNTRYFLEVVCKYGGDIEVYRVYDDVDEPSGFYMTEG